MGHAKGKAQCGTHAKLQVRREAHVGRHEEEGGKLSFH
jgi:hypothetical protein